jgi:hypothetical protein
MWEDIQYYAIKVVELTSFTLAVAAVVALAENLVARLKGGKRSRRT